MSGRIQSRTWAAALQCLVVVLVTSAARSVSAAAEGQAVPQQLANKAEHEQCQQQQWPVTQRSAQCHLELVGYGSNKQGIRRLRLNCTSDSGWTVPVGVASSVGNNPLAASNKGLAQAVTAMIEAGSGTTVVDDLPCQEQAERPLAEANEYVMFGVLYFCSGNIELVRPVIRDLLLPYSVGAKVQDDTAAVVVGGSASVTVVGARIERVNASTAIAVLQGSRVLIKASAFSENYGNPGSAVYARDSSVLRIESTNITNSSSSDHGGAIAVMGCSNATIVSSSFVHNRAQKAGGAIFGQDFSSVTLRGTQLLHNTASLGGAIASSSWLALTDGTRIASNTAEGGGGVFMSPVKPGDSVRLLVSEGSEVTDNRAFSTSSIVPGDGSGGGVLLGLGVVFNSEALRGSVWGNTALRDNDMSTVPEKLAILSDDPVEGYVKHPMDGQGLLTVQLQLLGEGDFPLADRMILAYWQPAGSPPDTKAFAAGPAGSVGSRFQPSGTATNGRRLQGTAPGPGGQGLGAVKGPMLPQLVGSQGAVFEPKVISHTNGSGIAVMRFKFEQLPGRHNISFVVNGADHVRAVLTVGVRECWRGEKPVDGRAGVCAVCPPDSYNFEAGECLRCPAHAWCPGGTAVLAEPGWWLSSPQNNQPHRCPNPQACMPDRNTMVVPCSDECSANQTVWANSTEDKTGACQLVSGCSVRNSTAWLQGGAAGMQHADQQCATGHVGHLCGRCASGFGSTRVFHCQKCRPRGWIIFMYLISSLLLLAFMRVMCWFHSRDNSLKRVNTNDADAKAEPTHLLRQLVLFSQYLLIVASVQAADSWPPTVGKPLQALAWIWAPTSPQTLAPDCLAPSAVVPTAVAKVVFYTAMPLVLLLLLLLVEFVSYWVRQRRAKSASAFAPNGLSTVPSGKRKGTLRDRLVAAGMVLVFFFLPTIVRTAFGLFACIQIDQPAVAGTPNKPLAVGRFWLHDTNQQCFTGYHLRLALGLGIPLLAFVCAVPLFILFVTLHNKSKLDDPTWLQHYGFLVGYYKPRFVFWEAVVSSQTICLVAISVFSYTLGPFYQSLVMNIAILLIGVLLVVARPLAHRDAQTVAVSSMACLFLTSYSALTFAQTTGRSGNLSTSEGEAAAIPMFMGVVVLLVNLGFVGWVLWKLVLVIDWREQWATVCRLFARVGIDCTGITARCPECLQPVVKSDILPTVQPGPPVERADVDVSVSGTDQQGDKSPSKRP